VVTIEKYSLLYWVLDWNENDRLGGGSPHRQSDADD
jgi:hypothetical protein